MNKNKFKLICVRHLRDQNALKSYGLNGPIIIGQEEKIASSVQIITKEAIKNKISNIRILYTKTALRIEQTANLLYEGLRENFHVLLVEENRLDVLHQGEILLPKEYKDGEHFDPLMKAWDAICDEAYLYKNIDYRFGNSCGFKKYPLLAKFFLESGESFTDVLLRKYSLVIDFLSGSLQKENELLILCTQSDLPLLLMEFQMLAKIKNSRPENLPFACWQIYKEKIQKKFDGDIPMGYTLKFDLSVLAKSLFLKNIISARNLLEKRKQTPASSIQGIINTTDNDFSHLDEKFKTEIGVSIDSTKVINSTVGFYPISVIIPYYNSRSTILDVLRSIELQHLSNDELKRVEVIVVNDGWKDDLEEVAVPSNYTFDLKIITCKKNGGRSVARNIGARYAHHDILMFLDADNLISGECLREHSIRNRLIPNQLYTSLVSNILLSDVTKITRPFFKKNIPLPKPKYFNEFRVIEKIKSDSVGMQQINSNTIIQILKETDHFRDFGFGRTVAYYDLPSMYATYCVSVTKNMFDKIGGFSEKFRGWGMEDSFFGAKGIVHGAKIIPVLSCGSYSVNLPSHSGSEEKEKNELRINIERYKKMMTKRMD